MTLLLADVAAASADVGAASSRLAKVARIAELLTRAASHPRLAAVAVSWLSGELPQRQIGVGWAALRSLPAPATGPLDRYVAPLRPEQIVEVALDGVQASTRYPRGMALRFARVVRYRSDKTAAEADTVATVRALFEGR